MKKADKILKEVLKEVGPSEKELEEINSRLKTFIDELGKKIEMSGLDVEIFIGGSFAKNTLIKKDKYDVDIFLRFPKKDPKQNISELTYKFIREFTDKKKIKTIHGSRDYFNVAASPKIDFEIVPVKKVARPKDAENITDLSYFHVKYVNRKARKNLPKEIILAKAFCHANGFYGAESYIKGFSGYALELLICHYKSFMKFVREIAKFKEGKIIIDIEKHYKNKRQIMMDLNASKLESPIILIDPTHKQRNASATLSEETFENFRQTCRKFVKSPSEKFFKREEMDFEKIEKESKKKGFEFVSFETGTDKQEGDVAGSKLLKFYNHLASEVGEFFVIKDKGFDYKGGQSARFYFAVKNKKESKITGPKTNDKKNASRFKRKHKNAFAKSGRLYAKTKPEKSLKSFVKKWKIKNSKKIGEMYVENLKIVS